MAARFWVNGGDANWNNTNNWSTTSGGAGGSAVPLATDDVTFDVNGNSGCIINAAAVALTLTVTSGYTSTITFTYSLTVSGNVTLGANMGIAGSGGLSLNATANLTSNGKVCSTPLTLGGSAAYTLVGDWTNTALVTVGTNGGVSINKSVSEKLYCAAGLTWASVGITGTAPVVVSGTGTIWGGTNGSFGFGGNLTIDAGAGVVTFGSIVAFRTGTFTYVSGTVVTTGSTLSLYGNLTMDNWGSVTFNHGNLAFGTITITTGPLVFGGILTLSPNVGIALAGTYGFVTSILFCLPAANRSHTFKDGVEYTVVNQITMGCTSTTVITLTSSHATNLTKITFRPGCAQDLSYVVSTRIDSSNGVTACAYKAGNQTSCLNWINSAFPLLASPPAFGTLLTWGNGQTSNVLRVRLGSAVGGPLTGLSSSSAGLSISTIANTESVPTVYTQAAGTIESIVSLGTFSAPTATKCRFKEVDAINHPGVYELQLADARFAVSGAAALSIAISCWGFLQQTEFVVELVQYKPQDTSLGLLDLANAVETGWTLRKALRIILAALGGKLSGAATATVVVRSVTDSKDRITATVDSSGNRTDVTLDGA